MSDGQSHVSVVDKDGMAVALTTTVNLVFGSQVLDPETGILLNDEVRTIYGIRRAAESFRVHRWTISPRLGFRTGLACGRPPVSHSGPNCPF